MNNLEIANCYYDAFRKQSDFAEVPIAADVVFNGPSGPTHGAETFRSMLGGLARNVASLKVRHQLCDGDCVVSIYDLDLGTPGGPIPMAERLRIEGDAITEGELFFDTKRMGG